MGRCWPLAGAHRVSTDIDLTVAETSEHGVLLADNGRWLHGELQRVDGKPVEVNDRVCKVQFAEGRLDLARMDPHRDVATRQRAWIASSWPC